MNTKQRLGELLVDAGFVSEQQVQQGLRLQVGGNRRLGNILLQMGAITPDHLLEVLSAQLDLPIIDIQQERCQEKQRLVPRYLCKKYEVFPLESIEDNILRLAMLDPSDTEAISDIERFTGKAVEPCLARQEDINASIKRSIPLSYHDIFNPQSFTNYAKIASTITLILVAAVSFMTYRFYTETTYGTITRTEDAIIYKNHDLMLGLEQSGKSTLLGRGAYANGYYSINFDSQDSLLRFVEHKKNDLSTNQYEWVMWAVAHNQ